MLGLQAGQSLKQNILREQVRCQVGLKQLLGSGLDWFPGFGGFDNKLGKSMPNDTHPFKKEPIHSKMELIQRI